MQKTISGQEVIRVCSLDHPSVDGKGNKQDEAEREAGMQCGLS